MFTLQFFGLSKYHIIVALVDESILQLDLIAWTATVSLFKREKIRHKNDLSIGVDLI
jgi:hypothetical protein